MSIFSSILDPLSNSRHSTPSNYRSRLFRSQEKPKKELTVDPIETVDDEDGHPRAGRDLRSSDDQLLQGRCFFGVLQKEPFYKPKRPQTVVSMHL